MQPPFRSLIARILTVFLALLLIGLCSWGLSPSRVAAATPTTEVHVTGDALLPATAFVVVGGEVVWHNDGAMPIQIGSQPFPDLPVGPLQLFLPLLADPAVQGAAQPIVASPSSWTSDPIPPGGSFTRTFTTTGHFPFYISTLTAITGTVTVLTQTVVGSELVKADQGGTVAVDNTILTIPPGALADDTVITLLRPTGMTLGEDRIEYLKLEPTGLTFDRPVTLTLTYTDAADVDEDFLSVAAFDETTGVWSYEPITFQDQAANRLSLQIDHFSWRLLQAERPLYLVLKIPGAFLEPGDLLYNMGDATGLTTCSTDTACTWLPGHVAIFAAGETILVLQL